MKKIKLITLIIVIIAMMFILTGCTNSIAKYKDIEMYENENFMVIINNCNLENLFKVYTPVRIIVDKNTRIMYLDGRPMIDAEGKPLLYEGE